MSGLVFVNPSPRTSYAGISVSEDLVCVAFLERLEEVQFYGKESAFAKCPYWPLWRKNVTLFDGAFNLGRLLLDLSREAETVAFSPDEVKITETNGKKFVPIDRASAAPRTLRLIETNGLLSGVAFEAEQRPDTISAMLLYFWQGLRVVDGRRTLASSDRVEPVLSVVCALAAKTYVDDKKTAELKKYSDWAADGCPGERPEGI